MATHSPRRQRRPDLGLPGRSPRPITVAMLGAGSMFTPRLVNDLLHIPGEAGGIIALVDIDPKRLETMTRLTRTQTMS
jgi:alpha-galactosidase